jgi:endonuclease-8
VSEGPNVIQWARSLERLVGEPFEAVMLPRKYESQAETLVGECITAVDTHGKHLLIRLSDGRTLHCHGMLDGYWHVGAAGAAPQPEGTVRIRLRTAEHEALFLNSPVVELLTAEELSSHRRLTALGPDVMSAEFDREEAWRRLRAAGAEIAEAIVDQTVVAGIGNIYKAEGLFLAGIHPERAAAEVSREEVEALWDAVIPLMWREANDPGPWTTLPPELSETGESHWVYGRSGRPCLRCGTRIRFMRQGRYRRATFYCPGCQRQG